MSDMSTAIALSIPKTIRTKSEIGFPYYDLNKSIDGARVIHEKAGGRCQRQQLALLLGYSGTKNGGFLTRFSSMRMFGLVEEQSESIVLTERAKNILSPIYPSDAQKAKLDAFFNVELYRRVFDDFDGRSLPSNEGLQNLLTNDYKVVPNQVTTALRNLMESATTAGLFSLTGNRSMMVRPLVDKGPSGTQLTPPNSEDPIVFANEVAADGAGVLLHQNNFGVNNTNIHPALAGLLINLPKIGERLGTKRRNALIDAFRSTINFIYPEEEED
jgi:hypothetical protein